ASKNITRRGRHVAYHGRWPSIVDGARAVDDVHDMALQSAGDPVALFADGPFDIVRVAPRLFLRIHHPRDADAPGDSALVPERSRPDIERDRGAVLTSDVEPEVVIVRRPLRRARRRGCSGATSISSAP